MSTVLTDQKQKLNVAVNNKILAFGQGLIEDVVFVLFFRDLTKKNLFIPLTGLWDVDLIEDLLIRFSGPDPRCLYFLEGFFNQILVRFVSRCLKRITLWTQLVLGAMLHHQRRAPVLHWLKNRNTISFFDWCGASSDCKLWLIVVLLVIWAWIEGHRLPLRSDLWQSKWVVDRLPRNQRKVTCDSVFAHSDATRNTAEAVDWLESLLRCSKSLHWLEPLPSICTSMSPCLKVIQRLILELGLGTFNDCIQWLSNFQNLLLTRVQHLLQLNKFLFFFLLLCLWLLTLYRLYRIHDLIRRCGESFLKVRFDLSNPVWVFNLEILVLFDDTFQLFVFKRWRQLRLIDVRKAFDGKLRKDVADVMQDADCLLYILLIEHLFCVYDSGFDAQGSWHLRALRLEKCFLCDVVHLFQNYYSCLILDLSSCAYKASFLQYLFVLCGHVNVHWPAWKLAKPEL